MWSEPRVRRTHTLGPIRTMYVCSWPAVVLMYREKHTEKNLHKLPEKRTQGCIHSILPAAPETCVLPLVLPGPGLSPHIKDVDSNAPPTNSIRLQNDVEIPQDGRIFCREEKHLGVLEAFMSFNHFEELPGDLTTRFHVLKGQVWQNIVIYLYNTKSIKLHAKTLEAWNLTSGWVLNIREHSRRRTWIVLLLHILLCKG